MSGVKNSLSKFIWQACVLLFSRCWKLIKNGGILIALMLFSCCLKLKAQNPRINYNLKSPVSDPNIQKRISGALAFMNSFMDSYNGYLHAHPGSDTLAEYRFLGTRSGRWTLLFSTLAEESFLEVKSDSDFSIEVRSTDLPLQTALLEGEDLLDIHPYSKDGLRRDSMKYYYNHSLVELKTDTWARITGEGSSSNKVVSVQTRGSAIFFLDYCFKGFPKYHPARADYCVQLGVITCEPSFATLLPFAKEQGQEIALLDIESNYFHSEYFNEARAYRELKPLADQMYDKYTRSRTERNSSYTFVEFKRDSAELERRRKKVNVRDPTFVHDLLKTSERESTDQTGKFLQYFSSCAEFSIQWSFLNLIIFLVLLLIKFLVDASVKIGNWAKMIFAVFTPWGLIGLANTWAYNSKPPCFSFVHLLVPGFLFIGCVICATIMFPKEVKMPPHR